MNFTYFFIIALIIYLIILGMAVILLVFAIKGFQTTKDLDAQPQTS
jgi:hypothetical protein